MDMVPVYMGADDKGVVAFRQLQRKLPADLVRLFRRDLAGLKGLAKVISDHIVRASLSAGEIYILAFRQKKLRVGGTGVALMAVDQPPVIRLLRIFHIVDNVGYGGRYIPPFADMERHKPCGCYQDHPLCKLKRAAPKDSPCYAVVIFPAFLYVLRHALRTSKAPSGDERSVQECRHPQKAIPVDISHLQRPARRQAPYPPV